MNNVLQWPLEVLAFGLLRVSQNIRYASMYCRRPEDLVLCSAASAQHWSQHGKVDGSLGA
eukprot:6426172-Amphidinium_carterae.1